MRMRRHWETRELERAGKYAIFDDDAPPPQKLLTPRGWNWETYSKYDFQKTAVTQFVVPEPFQKPFTKQYHAPWKPKDPVLQGRTRLSQPAIHRAQTATNTYRITSPRTMMSGSNSPRPFPSFAN